MTRRQPATSIDAAINAMANAGEPPLEVPKHCNLRDGDKPFWDGIVCARARDSWTDADLVVAAQLARCQADIEREQLALDAESTVVKNERGTNVVNARCAVLEQFARREMALMRTLRLGGTVAGTPRDEAGARSVERQARKVRGALKAEDEEDSLLAA